MQWHELWPVTPRPYLAAVREVAKNGSPRRPPRWIESRASPRKTCGRRRRSERVVWLEHLSADALGTLAFSERGTGAHPYAPELKTEWRTVA